MPTVLFADADSNRRDLYARALSSFGFEVEAIDNAVECQAKLRKSLPDVLILDLNLPWGGGYGVLSVMHDSPHLCDIPVVLLATEGLTGLSVEVKLPIARILCRPISLYGLLKCVLGVATRPLRQTLDCELDTVPSEVFIG